MDRTPDDLERAAAAAGAKLLSTKRERLRDGTWTLAGTFGFDDPWAAARLLCILAEEDAGPFLDPEVLAWSCAIRDEAAASCGLPSDDPRVLDPFLEAVHANVQRFIRFEPEVGERFQSPRTTMIEGVGDCDCQARLVHALVRAQGAESELRFFDDGKEPTHAVAAPKSSQGHEWAETTIAAYFGEHPQEAYRRLGLDKAGARPDIGFLGLEFVTPGDVATRKKELDVYVSATDADVARCTTLDAPTRAAWSKFVDGWRSFMADEPGWFNSGAQGRQAADYTDTIHDWQTKLAAICTTTLPSAPIVPNAPQDPTVSLLKTIAVVVGLVAGSVVVVKVLDVIPKRRAIA